MRQRLLLGGGIALAFGVLATWVLLLLRNQRMQRAAARELKAAAEATRASEQRWKLLFEQSPLSVQMFSPDGQTKRFNQAWKNLFLLNDEQGYAFNVLNAPDLVASGAVNHIRKGFEGEVVQVPPVPFSVNTDPPETRWIGGLLYPLKNEAGEITEVVVIHHDKDSRSRGRCITGLVSFRADCHPLGNRLVDDVNLGIDALKAHDLFVHTTGCIAVIGDNPRQFLVRIVGVHDILCHIGKPTGAIVGEGHDGDVRKFGRGEGRKRYCEGQWLGPRLVENALPRSTKLADTCRGDVA
jgi:hypothetical protein